MQLREKFLRGIVRETTNQAVKTLWQCFDLTVREQGHRTALVHGEREITYSALSTSVQAVENALRKLKPVPGERLAIIADKTPEVVIALLAALRVKIVLVLINPVLKTRQIEHILQDSGATTLMCQPHKWEHLLTDGSASNCLERVILIPGLLHTYDTLVTNNSRGKYGNKTDKINTVTVQKWNQFIRDCADTESIASTQPSAEDHALILYTSGSTGKPKGVMLSHANLFHGALSVSTYLDNNQEDRILALMPLSFDYGLSQLTSAMYCGATLVLYDYLIPRGVTDVVSQQRITGVPAVPHLWNQLVKIEWPDVPHLRYITSTGGRLQLSTILLLTEKLPGTAIYSMYGFTEAFRATFLPPKEISQRPESIGKAVPHANIFIVDDDGRELPAGKHGELVQSGPLVSLGYWNDPNGTAAKFRHSEENSGSSELYAWSGDLAYKDEDGYIHFVSRKDDQVKLNGYRSSPSEIETTLAACPWIDGVCVLCIPDLRFGSVAVAFVVLNKPIELAELSQWSKNELPSFMVPGKWIILNELPVTANNKIDKQGLRAKFIKDT